MDPAPLSNTCPLGELRSRDDDAVTETNGLAGAPDGEYVIFRFNLSFVYKHSATETLTLVKKNAGKEK